MNAFTIVLLCVIAAALVVLGIIGLMQVAVGWMLSDEEDDR